MVHPSSSDEEQDQESGFSLTNILFGNIDDSGQLEEDFLDNDIKKSLSGLSQLGLSSLLTEVIGNEELRNSDNNGDNTSEDTRYSRNPIL